jgi:aryl-alcohol dehydrogenase-like predicted oxidoreductase
VPLLLRPSVSNTYDGSTFVTAVVAYAPLCRGFLSAVDSFDQLGEGHWHKAQPRFSGDAYEANKRRVQRFFDLAKAKNCTPSQLALAWVHAQGQDVFPIPGTKSSKRIVENAHALAVLARLSEEEVQHIAECAQALEGGRYPEAAQRATYDARL